MKIKTSGIEPISRRVHTGSKAAGFTLVELLVVLTILATVLSVAVSYLGPVGDALTDSAREIVILAKQARTQAMSQNRATVLELDLRARSLTRRSSSLKVTLPEGMRLGALTAKSEQTDAGRAGIRFFPDGSSTGGRIMVQDQSRQRWITVDWLSGRISLSGPDLETKRVSTR